MTWLIRACTIITFTFDLRPGMLVVWLGCCSPRRRWRPSWFALLPHLDERQRRLAMGAEARALGHGGIKTVADAVGVSAVTVSRGVNELGKGGKPLGRTRKPGGGRKPTLSHSE